MAEHHHHTQASSTNRTSMTMDKLGSAIENLPSNESVLHNLNKVKVELDRAKTAPEIDNTGRRLLQDAELLVDDMKIMIKERNEGDRMQLLAREAKLAAEMIAQHSSDLGKSGKKGYSRVDKKGIQEAAREGFKSLQVALTELIRSSEFRSEIMEFLRLCADTLRTGVKDTRKHQVAETKYERKMRRLDKKTPRETMYTSEGVYHCKQCEIEAEEKRKSKRKSREAAVPEKVLDMKDSAEIAVNQQLSQLNIPTRLELSEEQLEELVDRFMDLMRNISEHPRTREAFMGIMHFIQLFYWELERNSGRLRKDAMKSASTLSEDDHVRNVILLAREELEQFTGGRSVKPFFKHFKEVSKILREDEETRLFFRELFKYVNKVMKNPQEYLDKRDTANKIRDFITRSRSLKNRDVQDHLYDALREGRRILKKITHDPVLTRMRNDFTRLIDDITKDSYGNFKLDGDVWNQIRLILTYSVIERVRIPLPPIESEDEKRQYRVKDVVLNLRDFVPQSVTLEDHARMQFDVTDLRHPRVRKTRNIFCVYLKNIHFEVHDVDIWFRRKRAPHMETSLKADVEIGPNLRRGLDLAIELVSKPGRPGMFQVHNVTATINSIRIHVADTGMAFMYNAVLKLIKGRIAHKMERSMEDGIRNGLEALNRVLIERIANPTKKYASAMGDKAGEIDINDIIKRFGETSLGQQAMRGLHMAKGDTAAGKRDRRHAKKHTKEGLEKGKKQAKHLRDKAGTKIGDRFDTQEVSKQQQEILPELMSAPAPVQESGYVASYVDRSDPMHPAYVQDCERCSKSLKPDGSLVETVVHQEKVTRM